MMKTENDSKEAEGCADSACSVQFDHAKLHEFFDEIEHQKTERDVVFYNVRQGPNCVDHLTFLTRSEMRIHVDNFPGQKRFYASNLPLETMEQFQRDFERTGLTLTFSSQNAKVLESPDEKP